MESEPKKPEPSIPKIIQEVGFDFSWSEPKVWALEVPEEEMPIQELIWHFDIPFLGEKGGVYNLTPREMMEHPEQHQEEYQRSLNADTTYPVDIMENKGRWLILDGLHRLMKLCLEGNTTVKVRKIPRSSIPDILE
ncbi:MAG: hypothetical protein AAB558_02620 [Patescibacteria group bacterium]